MGLIFLAKGLKLEPVNYYGLLVFVEIVFKLVFFFVTIVSDGKNIS